jgi:hypothetical protein
MPWSSSGLISCFRLRAIVGNVEEESSEQDYWMDRAQLANQDKARPMNRSLPGSARSANNALAWAIRL